MIEGENGKVLDSMVETVKYYQNGCFGHVKSSNLHYLPSSLNYSSSSIYPICSTE